MKNFVIAAALFVTFVFFQSCTKNSGDYQNLKGWHLIGENRDSCEIGIEKEKYEEKPVYFLKCNSSGEDAAGTAGNNINPANYLNKRVRLSGFIKTGDNIKFAEMFMRVDGGAGAGFSGETLCFDDMENRPILSGTGWKKYDIVLDIPQKASSILYGVHVCGRGQVWFSDLAFDVVGNDVPVTNQMK